MLTAQEWHTAVAELIDQWQSGQISDSTYKALLEELYRREEAEADELLAKVQGDRTWA